MADVRSDIPAGDPRVRSDMPTGDPRVRSDMTTDDPRVRSDMPTDDPRVRSDMPTGDPRVRSDMPTGDPRVRSDTTTGDPRVRSDTPTGGQRAISDIPTGDPRVRSHRPTSHPRVKWQAGRSSKPATPGRCCEVQRDKACNTVATKISRQGTAATKIVKPCRLAVTHRNLRSKGPGVGFEKQACNPRIGFASRPAIPRSERPRWGCEVLCDQTRGKIRPVTLR
jgi:hypothetical protein